jgi:two-component system sensor histidine kinase GlrK
MSRLSNLIPRRAPMTFFSRTILGYLIFVLLISAVSVFVIYQLGEVNKVTRSIILFDNNLLGSYEKLTNTLFLETRNEKKFIIMQDQTFYDGYQQAKDDFNEQLYGAVVTTQSPSVRDKLYAINRYHHRMAELVAEEISLLKDAMPYAKELYESEKEKNANQILSELKFLKLSSEKDVIKKVMTLSEMGLKASNMAVLITIISLLIGLILSFVATRSIIVPLAAMKKKTREIATGNLDGELHIPSPPEIAELADSLNYMRRRLKEVDTMKSDFLSLMSHELRTPLTSIKEGTNMLLEGLVGEINSKQGRLLSIIAEESNRLIGLVSSLLDLSKMEAGMLDYHFAPANIAKLIEQTVTEILPLAESKHITIKQELGDDVSVRLDTERILQVLRNLIGNAVKFTPSHGRILITLATQEKGVRLAIADSGSGIPAEQLERIFGKFQQISLEKHNNVKGTGLGLAIVKHIITAHGGKVWVESKIDHGSTFFVFLPA